jgi:hypothetical protein
MVNDAKRLIVRARIARLPAVLRQYAVDGIEPPGGLARAYLRTVEAFDAMIDATVGGDDFAEAGRVYQSRCGDLEAMKRNPAKR